MSLTATAPASSAARATSTEKVSALTGTPAPASPSIAGTSAAISISGSTGGPLRAATAPTSNMSNPASTSPNPSRTACSGVTLRAPSNIESVVTLTIPAATGCSKLNSRSASFQVTKRLLCGWHGGGGSRTDRGPPAAPPSPMTGPAVGCSGSCPYPTTGPARRSAHDHPATVTTHRCHCDASTPTSTAPCSARAPRSSATPRAPSRWPSRAAWRPATGPGSRS